MLILIGALGLSVAIYPETGLGFAQQPSTSVAPLFNANAKYVQGVGPGYWPTAGAGLTLNLAAGTAMCGSPPVLVSYVGGTLAMTASQTNYVYLDPTLGCAPAFNTAGFLLGQIPLAKVATGATTITSITDARNWFIPQPVGENSAGIAVLTAPLNATVTDSTSQLINQFPGAGYIPWWWLETNIQPSPGAWQNLQPVGIGQTALDGGFNVNQNGQSNKTDYSALSVFQNNYTPGEHVPFGIKNYSYGLGDNALITAYEYCYGGRSASGDEGCEGHDFQVFMGNVEYAGTVSAGAGTGSVSLSISPTQGSGTQGVGRWLLDTSAGRMITGGTTSAFNWTSYTIPPTVTISNAVASTVVATLGTAVTFSPTQTSASVTMSPAFSTGSISNITTSTVIVVADAGEIEWVIPTVVNTGAGTFTATFRKPHPATATISGGGLAGYFYGAMADQLTQASFGVGATFQNITGTLRQVWPIISSTPTVCQLWIDLYGSELVSYPGMWSTGTNGHTLYPGAEITSVRNGGTTVSNTLTLGPNAVAWTSGDTVTLPLYPVTDPRGGQ